MNYVKIDENWKTLNDTYKCPVCDKEYSKKGIMSHIIRTHQSVKFGNGYNGQYNNLEYKQKIQKALNKHYDIKLGEYKEYKVTCSNCNKDLIVTERETKFPSKEKYFCSRSCVNTRKHSTETIEKIKKSINHIKKKYYCIICGDNLNKKRKYCNDCLKKQRQKGMTEFRRYQRTCSFDFNIGNFPNEFDFDLIRKYGWYSASNRGNNIEGVSRDHCVSIRYGFDNNISPEIIKHPANCKLLIHRENSSKHIKCSMNLEELYDKIKNWNEKYATIV